MTTLPSKPDDKAAIKILLSIFTSLNNNNNDANRTPSLSRPASAPSRTTTGTKNTIVQSLHELFDGPNGVVHFLLPRILFQREVVVDADHNNDDDCSLLYGDNALSLLSYLVESYPDEYMIMTASSVRRIIEQTFSITLTADDSNKKNKEAAAAQVSDALLLSLSKLLIGTNRENNQVGIATDVHATLLLLCRWDAIRNDHHSSIAKKVLQTLNMLWIHIQQQQDRDQQRLFSTAQIRIAALMIEICLLGEDEMSLALSKSSNGGDCIMDKLLHMALEHPNNDPLLQVSALDQLERLTTQKNISPTRAEFLLGHAVLRRGLLCLVGSPGSLSKDASCNEEWEDADPINGGAALRLLTEICRVGILSSTSIVCSERTRTEFQVMLTNFQRALHNFHPQGEIERLSYIHAVSSLVGSCAMVASSAPSATAGANSETSAILNDTTLLHNWLSLHSRVSQPKLKSAVLCSLSQVMEPSIWQEYPQSNNIGRPSDSIVLQLYQAFSHANHERNATELLLASAKSPFVEERLGAYDMIRALVMRGVGVRLLLLYDDGTGNNGSGGGGSFLEWLLNQDLECTIEGKKAKYEIVHSMLSCNANIIGGLLPPKALRHLKAWDQSGPSFMVTVPWDMATE